MKKTDYKTLRCLRAFVAAIIALAALWGVFSVVAPVVSPFLVKAAIFSAALTMPEGAVTELKDRFGPAVLEATSEPAANPTQPPQSEAASEIPFVESPSASVTPREIPQASSAQPEIPKANQGKILVENMAGKEGGLAFSVNRIWLRNDTKLTQQQIADVLKEPMALTLEDTLEPQVLIYQTHATESFCPYDSDVYDKRYNWRTTDNNNNMVAVGAVMAQVLREQGIGVIQDTGQHDYPSYDGSYANSYRSVKDYLARYPTIKVVLDLHRDAIEREGSVIVKPTVEFNGKKYAQLMIVSNCDDGSGLIPNWRENLRFAAALCDKLEQNTPQITRPILFSYRKYNQQLSTGALLLEFGSHANTLEESKRTAILVGEALSQILLAS